MKTVAQTLLAVQMQIKEVCAIYDLALWRICKNLRKAGQTGSVAVNSRYPFVSSL
jgi:hypothetical protein